MTNITINNKNRTLELTKKDYNKATKFGTPEYNDLQEVRKVYPSYKVVVAVRKAPKSSYKGLTYKYMEDYIAKHDDENDTILEEYMTLRAMTDEAEEAFAESLSYQEMKEWFLDKFPAIAEFHKKREAILAKKVA